jgi:lysophospholipase L1-like esterase
MKKRVKWLILVVCLLILIICIFIIHNRHYYAIAEEIDFYSIEHHHDDTLRIAFIGDSWAFYHQEHLCQISKILSDSIQKPVSIMSAGIPGATSKTIYAEFATDTPIQEVLKNGPDYCIISAGINDSNIKLGCNYYQQHVRFIIDFLLRNNIVPVVIEIPDYNIEKVYSESSLMQKIRRQLSMAVTGSNLDCRNENRHALNHMIEQNDYSNKIIIIREKLWNPSGYKDPRHIYKEDGIHLNEKGYEFLDSSITQSILKDYHQKKMQLSQ